MMSAKREGENDHSSITTVWQSGLSRDAAPANARLIAAAPELLQALRCMLDEAEHYGFGGNSGGHGTGRVVCNQARAAIAKATGQTPAESSDGRR